MDKTLNLADVKSLMQSRMIYRAPPQDNRTASRATSQPQNNDLGT